MAWARPSRNMRFSRTEVKDDGGEENSGAKTGLSEGKEKGLREAGR